MTTIKNINGIELRNCACGNWLSHWKWFSHQDPTFCAHKNCQETDLQGALVQKGEGNDRALYIVPLCSEHSHHHGALEIADGYRLVSADTKATCERIIGEHKPEMEAAIAKQTRFWVNTIIIALPQPDGAVVVRKPAPKRTEHLQIVKRKKKPIAIIGEKKSNELMIVPAA